MENGLGHWRGIDRRILRWGHYRLDGRARFGVEQEAQLGQRVIVKCPMTTHITNPSWEVWDCDQFIAQPGHQCGSAQLFDSTLAIHAWFSDEIGHFGLSTGRPGQGLRQ